MSNGVRNRRFLFIGFVVDDAGLVLESIVKLITTTKMKVNTRFLKNDSFPRVATLFSFANFDFDFFFSHFNCSQFVI